MNWLVFITALLGFLRQLIKYMNTAEEKKERTMLAKAEKLVKFEKALKACEEGRTDELEDMFAVLRPGNAELSDKGK